VKLSVRNIEGKEVTGVELDSSVFGAPLNAQLLHQAMVYHQANQRQGTSNTLTRGRVSGGGRKPFAQKHTGRARMGTIRSPLARHGGVVFGPHPRSYRQRLPRKMRQQAIRCALSGKVDSGQLILLDGLEVVEAKAKFMSKILADIGVSGSVLMVLKDPDRPVMLAARNIPRAKILHAGLLNVLDLLRYKNVVMTVDAAKHIESLWGTGGKTEVSSAA
jgi:large subunit ribosomal protein L4